MKALIDQHDNSPTPRDGSYAYYEQRVRSLEAELRLSEAGRELSEALLKAERAKNAALEAEVQRLRNAAVFAATIRRES